MSQVAGALGHRPVSELKGVGPKMAEKLRAFGLHTIQDVLFHLPHRYEDRTRIYNICDLHHGLHASI